MRSLGKYSCRLKEPWMWVQFRRRLCNLPNERGELAVRKWLCSRQTIALALMSAIIPFNLLLFLIKNANCSLRALIRDSWSSTGARCSTEPGINRSKLRAKSGTSTESPIYHRAGLGRPWKHLFVVVMTSSWLVKRCEPSESHVEDMAGRCN